jgi:membrane-associated phospholipid phosphatase
MHNRLYNLIMLSFCILFTILSACGMVITRIRIDPYQFSLRVLLLLLMVLVALFYHWRGEEKLLNLVTIAFWTVLFGNLHLFPMFIAARFKVDLSDGLLAGIDHALGIEVPAILTWMGRHPALRSSLACCYGTLILLMTLAVLVLPLSGAMRAAKEYTIACVVSAMISIPLFAVFQAAGPWVYYGYSPQIDQSNYEKMLKLIKSNYTAYLDLNYSEGLICFPSFHTILAVLAAAALWPVPYLRWIGAAWGTLIVVSTVTTGTHYVIDVLGGLGVAVVAHRAARVYSALEVKWYGPSEAANQGKPRGPSRLDGPDADR